MGASGDVWGSDLCRVAAMLPRLSGKERMVYSHSAMSRSSIRTGPIPTLLPLGQLPGPPDEWFFLNPGQKGRNTIKSSVIRIPSDRLN